MTRWRLADANSGAISGAAPIGARADGGRSGQPGPFGIFSTRGARVRAGLSPATMGGRGAVLSRTRGAGVPRLTLVPPDPSPRRPVPARSYCMVASFMQLHGLLQNRETVSHAEISAWKASAGDALNRFYLPKLRESEGTPEWRLAI